VRRLQRRRDFVTDSLGKTLFNGNGSNCSRTISLLAGEETVAQATKTSPLFSKTCVETAERELKLDAVSLFTRRFVVSEEGRNIGSISPLHPFTRASAIELPSFLGLPEQAFLFVLSLLLRQRRTRSQ